MDQIIAQDYQNFILINRIKVNHYLNKVLWFFVIAGPAIALGVKAGVFPDITYRTCFNISLLIAVMSVIHFILVKRFMLQN